MYRVWSSEVARLGPGASENHIVIVPGELRLFILTGFAPVATAGRIRFGNELISVPAGQTFTLSGSDFPDCPLGHNVNVEFLAEDDSWQDWVVTAGTPNTYGPRGINFDAVADLVARRIAGMTGGYR